MLLAAANSMYGNEQSMQRRHRAKGFWWGRTEWWNWHGVDSRAWLPLLLGLRLLPVVPVSPLLPRPCVCGRHWRAAENLEQGFLPMAFQQGLNVLMCRIREDQTGTRQKPPHARARMRHPSCAPTWHGTPASAATPWRCAVLAQGPVQRSGVLCTQAVHPGPDVPRWPGGAASCAEARLPPEAGQVPARRAEGASLGTSWARG
jgi:hypothetical protein